MPNNTESPKRSADESTAKKAKVESTELTNQPSEEDEPMFSEEMLEERKRAEALRASAKKEPKTTQQLNSNARDTENEQESELEVGAPATAPEAAAPADTVPAALVDQMLKDGKVAVQEVQHEEIKGDAEAAPAEQTEASELENQEQTYDPNAYPGYIWNYETQQWETDPNYDPTQYQSADYHAGYDQGGYQCDYSGASQTGGYDYGNTYDQTYGQTYAYDQNDGYTNSIYPQADTSTYDQNAQQYYAGYDQQATYQYDETAQYAGYDQAAGGYEQQAQYYDTSAAQGNGYPDGSYHQTHAGYDQTAAEYSEPHIGCDQDHSVTPQPEEYNVAAPAPLGAEQQTAPTNYDYSQYSQSYATGYSAYQKDHAAQPYGGQVNVHNEVNANGPQPYSTEHDNSQTGPPQRPPPASVFTQPLFQSAPPLDPYAWNSTGHDIYAPDALSQSAVDHSQHSPSRPPPPSRPAPPKHPRTGAGNDQVAAATAAAEAVVHAPPPPRPPSASHPHPAPSRPGPPSPRPPPPKRVVEPEPEEDAWTQFKKMTEQVNVALKSTETTLKTLSETTAVKEIKDESYLGQIGGSQGYSDNIAQREIHRLTEEMKQEKKLKKKLKQQGKKVASPTFDPDQEDSMDRAAQELAMKMANMRTDLADWKPPSETKAADEMEKNDSVSTIPPNPIKDTQQDSGGSLELPAHLSTHPPDSATPVTDSAPDDPKLTAPAWADFESTAPELPPSESGFFSNKDNNTLNDSSAPDSFDPFVVPSQFKPTRDPFAPPDNNLIDEDYDPFAVKPVEDIVAAARAKAEEVLRAKEAQEDVEFFSSSRHSPTLSSPTPEGGSPVASPNHRPDGFEDDFKAEGTDMETPTPLYDEDDSEPLTDFMPKFAGDGWDLMIRHPIKKKSFMAERFWKPCYVRLQGNNLLVYNAKTDNRPIQELLLQASYSLSDTTLQAYDVYGKIHTVKLQYVLYKEKVGIRPGQISRLVDGHITKYGLPLEHTAQCTVLLKFGSLTSKELQSFVSTVEDVLFKCPAKRDTKPVYKQDEVQIHCYDEYSAYVDKEGVLSDQKARVRLFCLAFVSGSPFLEIGLNDRRRQGKEIVRRKDILPMYTERWIRFEELEFHSTVDRKAFEEEQVIRLSPPDGCFFEVMRFRVRPPRNREKALSIKAIMKIAGSKVEIRIEAMAAAQIEKNRGGKSTRRQIPCEDIAIRFPIPEAWIYIFREERHWGVGSVHSKKLRPGKVKNLKDRLLGAVQSNEANLIECAIGEAKYEHVFRSLVWRIPRLPEKHHAAYKSHLLRCRFELSSFDLMPDAFLPRCEVDFTMPLATVSNTVVRSVSVEQHEDSDRVEKFVRYVAKCQYKVEIDYVQCADLEVDTMDPTTNPEVAMATVPELHQPAFKPTEIAELHEGYRIEFSDSEIGVGRPDDSSSDDDDDKAHKMPIIQIDMKNYGY